jgi:hypothetical protein
MLIELVAEPAPLVRRKVRAKETVEPAGNVYGDRARYTALGKVEEKLATMGVRDEAAKRVELMSGDDHHAVAPSQKAEPEPEPGLMLAMSRTCSKGLTTSPELRIPRCCVEADTRTVGTVDVTTTTRTEAATFPGDTSTVRREVEPCTPPPTVSEACSLNEIFDGKETPHCVVGKTPTQVQENDKLARGLPVSLATALRVKIDPTPTNCVELP